MRSNQSTSSSKLHDDQTTGTAMSKITRGVRNGKRIFMRHLHFVGPGLVSSVAYIDPGNWATDLQAGSKFGYKLLFVVLIAGLAAVVLQTLSVRLGSVTSSSLPHQTRLQIMRLKEKHPKYRVPLHCLLWFLYILAEVAIIGTDLAELLGTAIALNLLFPALPLFAGVLITAADSFIVLLFFRSSNGRHGMLLFEIVIVTLVLAVFVSFMILLKLINPVWKDVFLGLVPSKTLVDPDALYIGVGIIGATVMPHALFLGSSLASVDRLDMVPQQPSPVSARKSFRMPSIQLFDGLRQRRRDRAGAGRQDEPQEEDYELEPTVSRAQSRPLPGASSLSRSASGLEITQQRQESGVEVDDSKPVFLRGADNDGGESDKAGAYDAALKQYEKDLKAFDRIRWVDLHVRHATADTIMSLLGFALTINASILTLAGAAFYYQNSNIDPDDADLFGAHALIKDYIGNGAAIIFALALLCAGQSASITCTLAGQVVSEGFLNWRISPFLRRIVTRLIGVVPAAIVAAALGARGLNAMLVASQVLLSVVLPTVIFPLVYLCSREDIMTVQGPQVEGSEPLDQAGNSSEIVGLNPAQATSVTSEPEHRPIAPAASPPAAVPTARTETRTQNSTVNQTQADTSRKTKSYKSPMWITVLGYLLFFVVIIANVYVFVQLGLGH